MITKESLENGTTATDTAASAELFGAFSGMMTLIIIAGIIVLVVAVVIPLAKNMFSPVSAPSTPSRIHSYN